MSNTIYLVYDPKIETKESLKRFIDIMVKADLDSKSISPIVEDDFSKLLEKSVPNFAICLNKTYKEFNTVYSDKLDVPIFEFFSKEFVSSEYKICLSGILLDIDSVFKSEYKRYAWNVLLNFAKNYNKYKSQEEIVLTVVPDFSEEPEIHCDYLEEPSYLSEERNSYLEVTQVKTESFENNDEFKSFYLNVKQLISQFNIVQDQLKLIENKFSDN